MKVKHLCAILAAVCLLTAVQSPVQAATIALSASNDTYIRDGRSYTVNGVTDNMDFRFDFTAYFQFDLSALNVDTISSATLKLHKIAGVRNDGMVSGRVAPYGLSDIAGNTEQNWDQTAGGWTTMFPAEDHGLDFRNKGNDWLAGTGAVAANLTNLDFESAANVTETITDSGTTFNLSGPDVVAFLNGRADANGLVTFLMENTDTGGRGWGWATIEHADGALHPTLELEYTALVPEPASLALMGLAVVGLGLVRRQ